MAIVRVMSNDTALPIGSGRRSRYIGVLLAILLAGPGAACSEINYTGGRPVNLSALDQSLQLGVALPADVRAALGEPAGLGSTMLPVDSEPRETWYYYYEEGRVASGSGGNLDVEMGRTFLFVYFDDGRYDGYMWFSSLGE